MTTLDPLTVTMRLPAQYSSSVADVWAIGSSTSRTMCSGRGNSGAAAWTERATDRDRTSQTPARVVIKPRFLPVQDRENDPTPEQDAGIGRIFVLKKNWETRDRL